MGHDRDRLILARRLGQQIGMARSLEDTRIRLRLGEVTCPGNYEVTLTVRSVDTGSGHYDLGGLRGSACVGTVDDIGPHGELRATH